MTEAPDLDALWSAWGIRSYGKAGRQIARELQGLVRDTVHQERVRMDASAEAAVVAVREASRAPFDRPPGFAARRGAAAPAPGPADPSHADLEPHNGAASPVENEA